MKSKVVNSGRDLDLVGRFPFALIAKLRPPLIVDVGAAYGEKAKAMLDASPASRLVAYEPFSGNLPHLETLARSEPRLTVRPAAASDRRGEATLYVSGLAPDDMTSQQLRGTSFVGSLRTGPRARGGITQTVQTVRLDDEIHERIGFLKLDVQGAEYAVLRGARALLEQHGADYIYLEFNGDLRVLRLLARRGYILFDNMYLAWPGRFAPHNLFRRRKTMDLRRWRIIEHVQLGSGMLAEHVWPRVPARGFAAYCAWFAWTRLLVCGLQTDILAVHRSQLAQFARLCVEAKAATRAGKRTSGTAD